MSSGPLRSDAILGVLYDSGVLFLPLMKCMTLYFLGANLALCRIAQRRQLSWSFPSASHVPFVEFDTAIRYVSSTNPTASVYSIPSRREAVKKRNRIGEIVLPYGIPYATRAVGNSYPGIAIVVSLSFRKDAIKAIV